MLLNFIKKILSFCIETFRPLFGPASCRFSIGCTKFALIQLREEPLLKALHLIARRLLSCNPFTSL